MVKERQDITGLNCIEGASGKVIVDDKLIKDSWKEYMEKLMNEENDWDHKILAEVKEGPADCIRMAEVRALYCFHTSKSTKGLVCQTRLEDFVHCANLVYFRPWSITLWYKIILLHDGHKNLFYRIHVNYHGSYYCLVIAVILVNFNISE